MSKNNSIKCSYLGPAGTYSEIAAKKFFGENNVFIAKNTIADVFDSVTTAEADYGVVPIENSIEGSVNMTMDLFEIPNIRVVGMCYSIRHFLLSCEKSNLINTNIILTSTSYRSM